MAARYQSQILAQIRDGKRFWSYAEIGKDFDAFRSEVVERLRQLKYEGVIPALSEIEAIVEGRECITGIQIIGGVKGLAEEGDE
jgi:hypothetical protein